MQAEWAKKRLIWVPHEKDGFASAYIKEDNGETLTVEMVDTRARSKLSKEDCQEMNPPKFDKVYYLNVEFIIMLFLG